MAETFQLKNPKSDQPFVIAGPCMAESKEVMMAVADEMVGHAQKLGYRLVFKSSFDKANRTSINSERGPGLAQAAKWFAEIKEKHDVPVLTDIHETGHVKEAAEVVDVLQIPAFLCRQTDLLVAAVETGRAVNVKKGQFLAPSSTKHIVNKAKEVCEQNKLELNFALTERGASFGYGDLVVDMRGFAEMSSFQVPVIFDITHSCQKPAAGQGGATTGGARAYAPLLARSAVATGYVDGLFLEVHPDPVNAKSDAQVQLNISQAKALLDQVIPLWKQSRKVFETDRQFMM